MSSTNEEDSKIEDIDSKELYDKLNSDVEFKINWITFQFDENDEIRSSSFGEGGYKEGFEKIQKDQIVFLVVRGCHVRLKVVQKFILLLLFIPEEVQGYTRAKAAFQVDVLSKKLEINHFALLDSRKDSNLEMASVTERIKVIFSNVPGKYVIDESSNSILQKYYEEKEKKKEAPQSESKRRTGDNVFKEILKTEETYVNSLKLFLESYINPMKDIVPDLYKSLLLHVQTIVSLNEPFLKKLIEATSAAEVDQEKVDEKKKEEKGVDEQKPPKEEVEGENEEEEKKKKVARMVDVLVAQCPVFRFYLSYVNSYQKLLERINRLMQKDSKFRDFCNKKKQELTKKRERCTEIEGFLIMPIQRIPRYQLLMRDLLKQTHELDPNYPKIKEGLEKTLELAQYVNAKKAEAQMSAKTISISLKFKMNDLMTLPRRMLKYNNDCKIRNQNAEIAVFTDLLVLIKKGKHIERISLADIDIRVYVSENDKTFALETHKKKHTVEFKNKDICSAFIELIQTRLSVNVGQASMSQRLMSHVIFASNLLKEGGKFKALRKKRWHILTADLKIKYYDRPGGKMKGGYSVVDAVMGKGGGQSDFKYGFYIKTPKRTYQTYAGNVEILDIWIRVLELVGLKREDFIEEEVEIKQREELFKLLETRDKKFELAELRKRQAEEEAKKEKDKEENFRKMFLKLNSMIKNMPNSPTEEEGEEDSSSDDDDDEEEGEGEGEGEGEKKDVEIKKEEISEEVELKKEEEKKEEEEKKVEEIKEEKTITKTKTTPKEGEEEKEKKTSSESSSKPVPPKVSRPSMNKKPPPIPTSPRGRGGRGGRGRGRGQGRGRGRRKRSRRGANIGGGSGGKSPINDPIRRMRTPPKPKNLPVGGKTSQKMKGDEKEKISLEEERLEIVKKKTIVNEEIRVRRETKEKTKKLIDKIRRGSIHTTMPPLIIKENEEKKNDSKEEQVSNKKDDIQKKKEGEEEKIGVDNENLERIITKKIDIHAELKMVKKKKGLFRKILGGKKKKKKKKKGGEEEEETTTTISEQKKKEDEDQQNQKIPTWKAKKNVQKELLEGKKKGSLLKGKNRRPSTFMGGNSNKEINFSDVRHKIGKSKTPPRKRPAPKKNLPWKNKQDLNKELLFMKKMMNKNITAPEHNAVKKEKVENNVSFEELLKEERKKWELEFQEKLRLEKERWMKEDLVQILEEKKKEWRVQELKSLRIQIDEEIMEERKRELDAF